MAFRFFRRRQKLVLIVMVALMVAFLIPSAFRGLGEGRRPRKVIGTAFGEKVRLGELNRASVDIVILRQHVRLGQLGGRVRGEMPFLYFENVNRGRDRVLIWVLLLHEASRMGIEVAEQEVDAFLASVGLIGQQLQRTIKMMGKLSVKDLRLAVKHHLMITEALELARIRTFPPLSEIRSVYRELRERIDLGMVPFAAADHVDKAPEPDQAEIVKWFERHRHALPLHRDNKTPFGFGYRQPNRADVSWLLVDQDRVREAVVVPDKAMLDYWALHKGELTKKVPIPTTSTAPASTQPTQPAEPKYTQVRIERYSEAKKQIREILQAHVADVKISQMMGRLRALIEEHASSADPYREAFKAMTAGAEKLLARRAGKLPVTRGRLKDVVAGLERASGVRIKFPYGEHEKLSIEPVVVVELKQVTDELTVGEVLEKIREALKLPELEWAACAGLDRVLFAAKPVDLLPVSMGRTDLVSLDDLRTHEVLGWAASGAQGGTSLVEAVATVKEFQPATRRTTALVDVGKDFRQPMYVSEPRAGRLLWRLNQAAAEQDPEGLTPAIRKQVIEDMKTVAAYDLARKEAKEVEALVTDEKSLEAVAAEKKLEYETSGPFSRKQMFYGRATWSYVPDVGIDPAFLAKAFALAPPEPEGWSNPGRTDVVDLRRQRKVMLIQRIGYEPPLEQEFDLLGMRAAASIIGMERQAVSLISWFAYDNVIRRVRYERAT